MAFVSKCPGCGLELTDKFASKCPLCGADIAGRTGRNIWIGTALQFAISTIFMLVFGFPKIMIAIFGGMILLGTALSSRLRPAANARQVTSREPLAHPVLSRVVGFAIAVCALAMFCILLFGFVMFLNSWNRWHEYEGQPFRRSEFVVGRVYYQRQSKSQSFYARGMVEGRREWMSLQPYLHAMPHSQAEAETAVPEGTSIPIYFFPNVKGRARVQVYEDTPPAEAAHRMAIKTLNNSLLWLATIGSALLTLIGIRRWCAGRRDFVVRSADLALNR